MALANYGMTTFGAESIFPSPVASILLTSDRPTDNLVVGAEEWRDVWWGSSVGGGKLNEENEGKIERT